MYQKPWSATHFGRIRVRGGEEEGSWAVAIEFVGEATDRIRMAEARRVASFMEILCIGSERSESDSLGYLIKLGLGRGIVNRNAGLPKPEIELVFSCGNL